MVIILTIKDFLKNKNARKIFGKREIEIMIKQLDGLTLTQSEKNRLSRDIRPKLEFIKEVSSCKDEFELKKGQESKKIIEKSVNMILRDRLKDDIKAILLFGSHSKGIVTRRSDIDIAVIFNDISSKDATKFRVRASGELPKNVDVLVFNTLPQKIKRSIARNHKVLYKRGYFDDTDFTIRYLKDEDYMIRMKMIFGEAA